MVKAAGFSTKGRQVQRLRGRQTPRILLDHQVDPQLVMGTASSSGHRENASEDLTADSAMFASRRHRIQQRRIWNPNPM